VRKIRRLFKPRSWPRDATKRWDTRALSELDLSNTQSWWLSAMSCFVDTLSDSSASIASNPTRSSLGYNAAWVNVGLACRFSSKASWSVQVRAVAPGMLCGIPVQEFQGTGKRSLSISHMKPLCAACFTTMKLKPTPLKMSSCMDQAHQEGHIRPPGLCCNSAIVSAPAEIVVGTLTNSNRIYCANFLSAGSPSHQAVPIPGDVSSFICSCASPAQVLFRFQSQNSS